MYVEVENKLNCCTHHDGFLVDMSLPPRDWSPLSEENVIYSLDSSKMTWICCGRNLRDGGCKPDKHKASLTAQPDKVAKHARALQRYNAKFEELKSKSIEKVDRAKPRK